MLSVIILDVVVPRKRCLHIYFLGSVQALLASFEMPCVIMLSVIIYSRCCSAPEKDVSAYILGPVQALLSIIWNADSINIKRDIKGFSKDLNNKTFYNSIIIPGCIKLVLWVFWPSLIYFVRKIELAWVKPFALLHSPCSPEILDYGGSCKCVKRASLLGQGQLNLL